ncbi:hypothetical protein DEA06_06000 [Microbacterium sp. Gd 4-13]|nr:hypothetical protein DEA06_06000 [Microbacterium sp. Gd 4-13]
MLRRGAVASEPRPGDPAGSPARTSAAAPSGGAPVLDAVYIAATIVLFALVALIARGVERL